MGNDTQHMMCVIFKDKEKADIKIIDLKDPSKDKKDFAKDIPIKREWFHLFCWLRYDETDNTVQLAYQTADQVQYFKQIKEGAVGAQPEQIPCKNPNMFYEDGSELIINCNYTNEKALDFYCLHKDGFSKTTFNVTTNCTVQEFGKIGKNIWYFIAIEGAAGKSTLIQDDRTLGTAAICWLWDAGATHWKDLEVLTEDIMGGHHFLEKCEAYLEDKNTDNVDFPHDFSMANNLRGQLLLSLTCSNYQLVTYHIVRDAENKLTIKKDEKKTPRSVLSDEISSWDRQTLYTWGYHNEAEDKVTVDLQTNILAKYQYLYYLKHACGTNTCWTLNELYEAVLNIQGV